MTRKIEIELDGEQADRLVVSILRSMQNDLKFWKDEPDYYEKLKTALEVVLDYFGEDSVHEGRDHD